MISIIISPLYLRKIHEVLKRSNKFTKKKVFCNFVHRDGLLWAKCFRKSWKSWNDWFWFHFQKLAEKVEFSSIETVYTGRNKRFLGQKLSKFWVKASLWLIRHDSSLANQVHEERSSYKIEEHQFVRNIVWKNICNC